MKIFDDRGLEISDAAIRQLALDLGPDPDRRRKDAAFARLIVGVIGGGGLVFMTVGLLLLYKVFLYDALDVRFGTLYYAALYGYLFGLFVLGSQIPTFLKCLHQPRRDDGLENVRYKFTRTTTTYRDQSHTRFGSDAKRSDQNGIDGNP
jgi:hypothetical protein